MEPDVMEDLDRRLRAACPAVGDLTVDEALLARLRAQPVAPRRTVSRRVAVPVAAAGATALVTATVMLAGSPGGGGPEDASAITQALHWFDPPAGTTLHARSVATQGGETSVRELWQSASDPADERYAYHDDRTSFELAPDGFYDPSNNTIYVGDYTPEVTGAKPATAAAAKRKAATTAKGPAKDGTAAGTRESNPRLGELPVGDPIVIKVKSLLERGDMHVRGPETHDGVSAWAIVLDDGLERTPWTLWVSADDGRPLELYDPGRSTGDAPQTIRWTSYDLGGSVQTLTQAHPGATVVDDPSAVAAAAQRLEPELR